MRKKLYLIKEAMEFFRGRSCALSQKLKADRRGGKKEGKKERKKKRERERETEDRQKEGQLERNRKKGERFIYE